MKPINNIMVKSTGEIITDYEYNNGEYIYTLNSHRKCKLKDIGGHGFICCIQCKASGIWKQVQFNYKFLKKIEYYSSQYIFLRNYDRKNSYGGKKLKYDIMINDEKVIDITFYYKKNICKGILCTTEDNKILRCDRRTKYLIKCKECGKYEKRNVLLEEYINNGIICLYCRSINHNPFKGKKHTLEFKNRLSTERKGVWGVGDKNPMYGEKLKDHMTEEKYEEWKEKQQNIDFSGDKNPMYGEKLKDHMTEEKYEEWKEHQRLAQINMSDEKKRIKSRKLSESQRNFMNNNPDYYRKIKQKAAKASQNSRKRYQKTEIEEIVDMWLTTNNINHTYSAIISGNKKTHQYDFIIHGRKILVEVNGDYWHGNPLFYNEDGSDNKRKLNEIQKNNMKNDIDKQELAKFHKFKIIYIWENQIKNNDFTSLCELLQNKGR